LIVVTLPGCIPEAVAAELWRVWADSPEWLDEITRMARRPAFVDVCQTLAAKLSGPEQWRMFFLEVFRAASFAHLYHPVIRPGRKDFQKQRDTAIRAARELGDALKWLAEGDHDYRIPGEVNFLWLLAHETARAQGYTEAAADGISRPLCEDQDARLEALIQGNPGPAPLDLPALLDRLADTLEGWPPEQDGQGQGTALGTVFVRAMDHASIKYGMDTKALFTDEQMAALTRAALGLREEPNKNGKRFDAGNVYQARLYAKK